MPGPTREFSTWTTANLLVLSDFVGSTFGASPRAVAYGVVGILCAHRRDNVEQVGLAMQTVVEMSDSEVRRHMDNLGENLRDEFAEPRRQRELENLNRRRSSGTSARMRT